MFVGVVLALGGAALIASSNLAFGNKGGGRRGGIVEDSGGEQCALCEACVLYVR